MYPSNEYICSSSHEKYCLCFCKSLETLLNINEWHMINEDIKWHTMSMFSANLTIFLLEIVWAVLALSLYAYVTCKQLKQNIYINLDLCASISGS